MREIKFRAWIDKVVPCNWDGESWSYKPYKAMKEVKSIHFGTGKIIISDKHGNHSEHPDNYTLMQYTGLKDKNGVEIYEGDIVKHWKQGNRIVIYPLSDNYAGFGLVSANGLKNTLNDGDKLYEVIGNIHQNPELLRD